MHAIINSPNFLRAIRYIQARATFDSLYLTSDAICTHSENQKIRPSAIRLNILTYYPKAHLQQPKDKELKIEKKYYKI